MVAVSLVGRERLYSGLVAGEVGSNSGSGAVMPAFDRAAAIDVHRCVARRSSVRAANLVLAGRLAGGMDRLAEALASDGHVIDGAHVSNQLARAIETIGGMPDGWMDEAHACPIDRDVHATRAAAITDLLLMGDDRSDAVIEVLSELMMHDPSDIDWLLSRACDYAYDMGGDVMEARWFVVGNHLCPDASSLISRTIEQALGMERGALDQ